MEPEAEIIRAQLLALRLARLLSFNNVIVTSHQAFFTKEAMTNIAHTTLQNVKDFAESRPLVNEVAVGRV